MDKKISGQLLKGALNLFASKTIWLSILAVMITTVTFTVYYLENIIYIIDGDTTTVTVTTERDAMRILQQEEILTTGNDTITYTSPTEDMVGQLVINRGYPVSVTVDGETHNYNWYDGTVATLLEEAQVTLDTHDKLTHELTDPLAPYENVTVTRVDYRSYENHVVLPKKVTHKGTSLLRNGSSEVLVKGSDGMRVDTFDEIIEDGVVVETIAAGSVITKQPVEETILVGDGSAVSGLDFSSEYPLDANGIPIGYKKVIKNQRATGYWRAGRPWGAWGRDKYCVAGTAAVRAADIPYGTKMYIRTPDGSFTYGYSVANDTGTALMAGVIDIDLYYESFRESQLNSVRWVDIYILE